MRSVSSSPTMVDRADLRFEFQTFANASISLPDLSSTAFAGWGVNLPGLRRENSKLDTERDFMALNKAALAAGLVTAPENYR